MVVIKAIPTEYTKGVYRLGMDHKLTEIGEGKHPLVIRKGVIHDQEERYHDKDGQEQDIRNGPVPSSHKKCRKRIDHFLPFLSMNNSNFIRGDRYAT